MEYTGPGINLQQIQGVKIFSDLLCQRLRKSVGSIMANLPNEVKKDPKRMKGVQVEVSAAKVAVIGRWKVEVREGKREMEMKDDVERAVKEAEEEMEYVVRKWMSNSEV